MVVWVVGGEAGIPIIGGHMSVSGIIDTLTVGGAGWTAGFLLGELTASDGRLRFLSDMPSIYERQCCRGKRKSSVGSRAPSCGSSRSFSATTTSI